MFFVKNISQKQLREFSKSDRMVVWELHFKLEDKRLWD